MTDARELRERVAKAIADAYYRDVTDGHFGIAEMGQSTEWLPEADAAIDLVLEQAAKVAEEYGEFDRKLFASAADEEERAAFERGAFKAANIAIAIRALKSKTGSAT